MTRWTQQRVRAVGLVALVALALLLAAGFVGGPIGASWREADTQAMAHHVLASGFDVLHPRVDWRGAGDGCVECEFPLFQTLVAGALAVWGDVEWPGRVISLGSLVVATLSLYRLCERRCGAGPALLGAAAFVTGGQAFVIGTRVMPDACSAALALAGAVAAARHLATGRTAPLVVAGLGMALGALAKPTALQLLPLAFVAAAMHTPSRWREPRLWATAAGVVAVVAAWIVHARGLGQASGLTFGVTFGDTKMPHLEHLLMPGLHLGVVGTTLRYGLSWSGIAAVAFLVLRRRFDRGDAALLLITLVGLVATLRYSHSSVMGPQYHAIAALAGGWFVARAWPAGAGRGAWLTAGVLVLAQAVLHWRSEAAVRERFAGDPQLEVAAVLRGESAPGDFVVVHGGKTRFDPFWRRPNNFEEPVLLYQSRRRGWVLPADGFDAESLAQLQQAGARWIVSSRADDGDSPVGRWLRLHATTVATIGPTRILRLRATRRRRGGGR